MKSRFGKGLFLNTGYRGRTGIFEVLEVSARIKASLTPDTDFGKLTDIAWEDGMNYAAGAGNSQNAAWRTHLRRGDRRDRLMPSPGRRKNYYC